MDRILEDLAGVNERGALRAVHDDRMDLGTRGHLVLTERAQAAEAAARYDAEKTAKIMKRVKR